VQLVSLFFTFMLIGAVAFGGGYAMLPLFERMIVDTHGWLSRSLFIDMIALSQVTPGPIAINSATFIGFQIRGVLGAFLTTTALVSVPVALISLVSFNVERFKRSQAVQAIFTGLRPALAGLIFASAYSLSSDTIFDVWTFAAFVVFSLLLIRFRVHPIPIIILGAVFGLLVYSDLLPALPFV